MSAPALRLCSGQVPSRQDRGARDGAASGCGTNFPAGTYLSLFIANGLGVGSSNLPDGARTMKTTQGWGWLTAGVLALGLNGFYHDGGVAWAHRIMDHVTARVADRSGDLG